MGESVIYFIKKEGLILMKKFLTLVLCFIFILSFCSCGKTDDSSSLSTTEETTEYITTLPATQAPTQNATIAPATQKAPETTKKVTTTKAPTTAKSQESDTTLTSLEKTGDMAFSDSADNRYIKAISQKYGVDSSFLIALYTVPENDSNIVLQFSGATKPDGKLQRDKSTLVAIYTIDKALNSKRASENKALNEYPYGEMKVIYFSTTKYIMPEFEKELNG